MFILINYTRFVFLWAVLIIYSVVIIYSLIYIEGDLNINQFNMLILLFVISAHLHLLILKPRILGILLRWDGLGLRLGKIW